MSTTMSPQTRQMLDRLAADLAAGKTPMSLSTFGELLAQDFFKSPEHLATYFQKPATWITKVQRTLERAGVLKESLFWKSFESSACRQREPIVLAPAGPGVVDNTTINHHNQ